MKKLIALSVAGLLAGSANAQRMQPNSPAAALTRSVVTNASAQAQVTPGTLPTPHGKTTAITAFVTDTFKSTSITSGTWTVGGNTGTDSWTWKNGNSMNLAAITSTTRAGGWLNYDAYAIAQAHANTQPQTGYVTSPSYSCSGHQYVGVLFQQYARRLADTFYVMVSTNNFATSTTYNVFPNNGLGGNQYTENPEQTLINISATAANQPSVRIRFYYSGGYTGAGTNGSGGTYGWSIDDFNLVDLDPIDLAITKPGVIMTLHNGITPMGTQPVIFADTVIPVASVNNYGGTQQTNIPVAAALTANPVSGAPLYTKSIVLNTLPINGFDSAANLGAGYKITTKGSYLATFSVNQPGDATAANNTDTIPFNISDTSLCVFTGYREGAAAPSLDPAWFTGGYYVHRPSSATYPNGISFYMGSLFEIPAGNKKDTITSINLCFYNSTVDAQVQVELYKLTYNSAGQTAYTYKGRSFVKKLASADISSSTTNLTFTTLMMNIGSTKSYVIADSGLWAAVVLPISPKVTDNVLLARSPAAAPKSVLGQYGISDTANGTAFTFAQPIANADALEDVPNVVVNFGNSRALLAVNDIAGVVIGAAYPNPANTILNIPVSVTTGATVNVSLSNMLGQVLKTESLGNMAAGQSKTAVISTSDIAAGVYIYTVESNGARVTNRVVVAH